MPRKRKSKKKTPKRRRAKQGKSKRKIHKQKLTNKTVADSLDRLESEVVKPASWFTSVPKGENVTSSFVWHVDKEKEYENYGSKFWKYWDQFGIERHSKEPPHPDSPESFHARLTIVLPDGKIITPIRQFCETKILPPGIREAFFYDFGPATFLEVAEGEETVPPHQPIIRSSKAEPTPRGTSLDIGYSEFETGTSVDIVFALNRSFSLESIHDEAKEVIERTFNDKQDVKWVDNNGHTIKSDDWMSQGDNPLRIKAIVSALSKIEEEGLDTSDAVLYTTGLGLRQLTEDPDIENYKKYSLLKSYHFLLERMLGIRIVISSACPTTDSKKPMKETYWQRFVRVLLFKKQKYEDVNVGTRSVLFLPNVAFGVVSGKNLTLEAQRRNEMATIRVTGTQRICSVLKNKECAVRISHA